MTELPTGYGPRPNRVESAMRRLSPVIGTTALLFLTTVGIPLIVAAVAPRLTPFTAKFPGLHTLDNPGGPVPASAAAFAPFRETLGISWDDDFLYIEGDGLPDHEMMTGITAWQQQVPLPHDFTGANRFKLPLKPNLLEEPQELTLLGPIALAVNGIPIFHALTQSGKDAYLGGELDQWGGHCGRADDYHYHIAPSHLEAVVGKGNPVAFGIDGHPVYLADPSIDKPLDECHGYFDDRGNYRYVGNLKAPYMMSYFRGSADLEDRPPTRGVRPFLQPLRGASITGFSGNLEAGYSLSYEIDGGKGSVNYHLEGAEVDFQFLSPDGTESRETSQRRPDEGEGGKGKGGPGGKGGRGEKGKPQGGMKPAPSCSATGDAPRTPWIFVHAKEIDTNGDGVVEFDSEMITEAAVVFKAYDINQDGTITPDESGDKRNMPRSALGGFVHEHATEMDRDRDGGISKAELTSQFARFFGQVDKNGDNRLTPDEYEVVAATLPAGRPGASAAREGAPNFVVFLIDDMGWQDMGFSGNTVTETPRTDEMARKGMIFTNAYASAPNCAPTRACLMSGQYPPRHGVYTVVDDRHTPGLPHHKVLASHSNPELATESVTVAEAMKAGGYATGMFGMWNLGTGRDGPTTPSGQGFEVFKQPRDVGFEKDRYFNDNGEYLTDSLTSEGISWMKANQAKPFFLYMAYHAVHSPFEPKPELVEKYRDKGAPDPDYAATVEVVDTNVGRIVDALSEFGLSDNTVVIFHSDNGGTRQYIAPLAGGKGTVYEGGLRVPTAVWGPGVVAGESAEPMLSMDIYPTMLEMAGLPKPSGHELDGVSPATLITGKTDKLDRKSTFWHFPCYIGGGGPSSAMRQGDWKVIELFESQTYEIYNLASDPGETKNLFHSEPEKAEELVADLRAWQEGTGAPRPIEANPNYDPTAIPERGREARGKSGGGGKSKP